MKRTKLIRISAVLLLCVLLLASLCSCASWDNFYNAFIHKEEVPEKVIKIAVFEPLTGSDASSAQDEINGLKLANALYPYVNGAKIELVYFDNKSNSDTAALTAAEIIRDESIAMLIGSYGNALTIAAADTIEEAGLPAVNVSSTNPVISNTTTFVCAAAIDAFPARAAAELMVNVLEQTEAAALYSSSDELSKIKAMEFSRYCEQTYKTGSVPVIAVNEGGDLYYIIKAIEDSGAKVIYFPAGTGISEAVMAKAEEAGLKLTWIGSDAWKNIDTEGIYYTADYDAFSSVSPMTERFRDAYQNKYGSPFPPENAALGFDAYLMAITAIGNTEDPADKEALNTALMNIDGLEGATGQISISINGSPVKSVQIFRMTDAGPELEYTAFLKQTAEETETENGGQ